MGTNDKNSDPYKLDTCPKCCTTNCPKKLDNDAPMPKHVPVNPTIYFFICKNENMYKLHKI